MKFLIYTSLATMPGEVSPDINAILKSSLRNNPRWDVTGWLHFERGRFYQVVEGPDAAVTLLMARLRADQRHYGLEELGAGEIATRQFAGFDMGFASADGYYLRPPNAALPPPGAQDVVEFLLAIARQRGAALSRAAATQVGLIRH